ncbi:MAG: CCA tRNA nucleotidyltransferase [Actinobacteria bacterium]|nr:CCA tRNA nucleotidyltransferase [Actinomycetota bacterium]
MAPSPDLRALPAAEPLAAVLPNAWVVGGAVRDLLLDRPASVDLDLVVEGDAVAVARRLAAALDGVLTIHDRFGTATVEAAGHLYDLATARAESYARPGALPDVRPGTLAEDLLRRDFTVNAIAVSLDGRVRAAPHAFGDLDARALRVLHERSFRDDPTRLLRLVRYATRLGFGVEARTAELAQEAVAAGALATVTPARIGGELRLLLREPSAVAALEWVAEWPLGVPLAFDRALAERALALLPADARGDLLLLGSAARAVAPAALAGWLDALEFVGRERDVVVRVAQAEGIEGRLAGASRPSEIAAVARALPVEAVALAGALGAETQARAWIEDLRGVRLAIDGADLLAAGIPQGAAVGRALAAALDARLDGAAPDRDAQLAVALAAAR